MTPEFTTQDGPPHISSSLTLEEMEEKVIQGLAWKVSLRDKE